MPAISVLTPRMCVRSTAGFLGGIVVEPHSPDGLAFFSLNGG
jgi:hypothetical protein